MKRKPSVRATRRQSSGSGRGQKEPPFRWMYYRAVREAYFEVCTELRQAQARIRELEAQLSKRKVLRRSKREEFSLEKPSPYDLDSSVARFIHGSKDSLP